MKLKGFPLLSYSVTVSPSLIVHLMDTQALPVLFSGCCYLYISPQNLHQERGSCEADSNVPLLRRRITGGRVELVVNDRHNSEIFLVWF